MRTSFSWESKAVVHSIRKWTHVVDDCYREVMSGCFWPVVSAASPPHTLHSPRLKPDTPQVNESVTRHQYLCRLTSCSATWLLQSWPIARSRRNTSSLNQRSTRGLARQSGRPLQSWLWTIGGDLKTQNIDLSLASRITHRRSHSHRVEETAILWEKQAT